MAAQSVKSKIADALMRKYDITADDPTAGDDGDDAADGTDDEA